MSDEGTLPKRPAGLERRDTILKAATEVFHRLGYHASSLEEVALASGIQKASLYYHFSSKDELLLRIIQDAMAPFREALEEIQGSGAQPRVKLREAIESHVLILCQNLEAATVMQHEFRSLPEEAQLSLIQERDEYDHLLEQIIQTGIKLGEFRTVDVKMAAYAILGMVNWLYRWYSPEGRLSPPEIASHLADFALAALENRHG